MGLGLGLRSELQGIHPRSLRIAKEEAHPAQRRVGLLLEVLEYCVEEHLGRLALKARHRTATRRHRKRRCEQRHAHTDAAAERLGVLDLCARYVHGCR